MGSLGRLSCHRNNTEEPHRYKQPQGSQAFSSPSVTLTGHFLSTPLVLSGLRGRKGAGTIASGIPMVASCKKQVFVNVGRKGREEDSYLLLAPLMVGRVLLLLGRWGEGEGGAQHIPSGRAARPGAHCPGAQPQAARTAPGSLLALEGTDTAQPGPEELSFPDCPPRGHSEQERPTPTQPPTLSSTTGPESLPLASFLLDTLPIPHRKHGPEERASSSPRG